MFDQRIARRRLWGLPAALFALTLSAGCGQAAEGADAAPSDAGAPDIDPPDADPSDADPPDVDPADSRPADAIFTHDTTIYPVRRDADAFSLPDDSVRTCGQFFQCLQNCPPHVESCVGPCHDAMTREAAAVVQAFVSCVNSHACRNEACVMAECSQEMETCFKQEE